MKTQLKKRLFEVAVFGLALVAIFGTFQSASFFASLFDVNSITITYSPTYVTVGKKITFDLKNAPQGGGYLYRWSFDYQADCYYSNNQWVCPTSKWTSWSDDSSYIISFSSAKNYQVAAQIIAEDANTSADLLGPINVTVDEGINMDEIDCNNTEGYVWIDGTCMVEKIPSKTGDALTGGWRLGEAGTVSLQKPVAEIKFDPGQNIIVGQEIKFTADKSVDGNNERSDLEFAWTWDQRLDGFNSWTKTSTDTHTYDLPGTYSFVLQVRGQDGQKDTTIARINVSNKQHAGAYFTANPTSGTTNTLFTLEPTVWDTIGTVRKDFRIRWDLDNDGEWDTDEMEPQTLQVYFDAGMFTPRLLVISPDGTETVVKGYKRDESHPDSGKIDVTKSQSDYINAAFDITPSTGDTYTVFTFDAGDTLPLGFNYDNLASSVYAFRWDFDGDGIWDTPWNKSPRSSYQFREDGTYSVTLEANKSGATNVTRRELKVDKATHPRASFVAQPQEGSQQLWKWEFDATGSSDPEDGTNLMYRWNFGDDDIWDIDWTNAPKAYWQFDEAGHYKVMLEVRDQDYFTSRAEKDITVYDNTPPDAVFTVDVREAPVSHEWQFDASGTTDRHTAQSALQGRWDWEGDGVWDTEWGSLGAQIFRHKYLETGSMTPTLQVRDHEGFEGVASQTIWVTPAQGPQTWISIEPTFGFFSTVFDAAATAEDAETATAKLKYNFDWDWHEGDINQTATSSSTSPVAQHSYTTTGWHIVRVETTDEDGMVGAAATEVYIHPDSKYIDWLIQNGGTEYTTYEGFEPDAYITRAELLKMLYETAAPDTLPYEPIITQKSIATTQNPDYYQNLEIDAEHLGGYEYKLIGPVAGNILDYSWDVDGDGVWDVKNSPDNTVTHAYSGVGMYNVILEMGTTDGSRRITRELDVRAYDPEDPPVTVLSSFSDGAEDEGTVDPAIKQKVKIPFADIEYEDWYAPYVLAAYRDDVMLGFRDRHFRPNEGVSVVGALDAICKMYNLDPGSAVDLTFPDVPSSAWYAPLASFAVENDLWQTDAAGDFQPTKPVTRAEAARMIYQAHLIATEKMSEV